MTEHGDSQSSRFIDRITTPLISSTRAAFEKHPARFWTGGTAIVTVALMTIAWATHSPIQTSRSTPLGSAYGPLQASYVTNGAANGAPTMAATASADAATEAAYHDVATSRQSNSSGRMVIERANIAIQLADPTQAAMRLQRLVAEDGGFVASMRVSGGSTGTANEGSAVGGVPSSGSQTTIDMTVRIPEADFDAFLSRSRGLGKVTRFSQTGQDVTQQYTGLQEQLMELNSEAAAYTRLFQKATSMKDMITIQRALSQVDAQITNLEAQAHNLQRSVQLATIHLTLSTPPTPVRANTLGVISALQKSLRILGDSAMALVAMVAWLI
ncbi:MAG: DUF4349 domain-containing protein, partial [Alicyclobacillus sp.]|nr:DUF4349 domain-containing protein [Alicyclobacillus sp.]